MMTNKETKFSCVDCHVQKCEERPDRSGSREGFPQFCVTPEIRGEQKEELLKIYSKAKNAQIMKAAAEVEFEGYGQLTRVQEIMAFARKIGARKIGIATCVGLIRESQIFAEILRKHDFEVYGMACKVGQIPKTYTEEDVIGIFRDTCEVASAHIIKDRTTGEHKGFAKFNLVTNRLRVHLC